MLAKFDFSIKNEVVRLLHTAHQIANGFYRLNGFIVLPHPQPHLDGKIVCFPDLSYLSIPRFWDKVAKLDVSNIVTHDSYIDQQLVRNVENIIPGSKFPTPDYSTTQKLWAKYEAQIINSIYALIPSKKNFISSIHVWPTTLGTSSSFNICDDSNRDIYIWLREGEGVASITEAILSAITRKDAYEHLDGMWQESEFLVDWLIAYSPLNSIIKKIDPNWEKSLTIKSSREKQNGYLIQKSNEFLNKIGVPSNNSREIDLINFSPRDKQIMNLLINSAPHPVSMDKIGDILFKNNVNEYSLFAISKAIQRLRDKLEQHGVSGSHIQTKRGEGYLLLK